MLIAIEFIKYFTGYIFFNKTRQRLLFIALFGLFLSSFALIVMQSVMGGLQNGVVKRARDIQGSFVLFLTSPSLELLTEIKSFDLPFSLEYEIELLLKHDNYLAPAILHGVHPDSKLPTFLNYQDMESGLVLGSELMRKMQVDIYSPVNVISPAHTNAFFGDIPRLVTLDVSEMVDTTVYEVDQTNAWTRASAVWNLIQKRDLNRVRFYGGDNNFLEKLQSLAQKYPSEVEVKTWEELNSSLVWALKLENFVMIALFVGMSLLVGISITSGYLLFFDKIKNDLLAFWIMGLSLKKIKNYSMIFLLSLSCAVSLLGLGTGLCVLWLLKHANISIMPDIFLEQNLPIFIESRGILLSFLVPYSIALFFSFFIFKNIKNDEKSFLSQLRASGE
ncbi:MAG: ABC transporter permease [Bacteriovoracaceae bacterium]